MNSIKLNVDLLHLIMGLCEKDTISQVMKTCRSLNREGVKHLLNETPTIENEEQASSFVQFALTTRQTADITHRLMWIDSLCIRTFPTDVDVETQVKILKPFFVSVAPHAPRFSHLQIEGVENFFRADPELPAAVASLTELATLVLTGAGEECLEMLRALQSRLYGVEVRFDPEIAPSDVERDPVSLLRRSEDSLHCISLKNTVPSPAAGCYRNVHTLLLDHVGLPNTRRLVQAFPNLQLLRAAQCTVRHDPVDPDAAVEAQRDLNVAEQARDGSWSGLASYKGSILVLYALGLACPVLHVHVHDDELEPMDVQQVRAVLEDARPVRYLTIVVEEIWIFLDQADDLIALCSSSTFASLASFELRLQLRFGNWDADLEAMMDCIYDALGSSSVPGFILQIDICLATLKYPLDAEARVVGPASFSPVKLFLDGLDIDAVADRLFRSNRARRAVKVTFIRLDGNTTVQRGHPDLITEPDFDEFF